jgi:hypothetical protein
MVFDAYRQATAATRGSNRPGRLVAAGLAGICLIGGLVWLGLTGPAPPPRVTVVLPRPAAVTPSEGAAPPPAPEGNGLLQQTPAGALPVAGDDGKVAWHVYARPVDPAEKRPRIAIVIDALGASATETDAAIRTLPGAVTLGFMPYWKQAGQWLSSARASGHEVLLDLPMEPPDASHSDIGPNGLRTALDAATNTSRLEWMMAQATGYVGFVGWQGGRFAGERPDMEPILKDIAKRGLLYVDNRASAQSVAGAVAAETGLPFGAVSRQIDGDPSRAAVERRLGELEDIARHDGSAIGLGGAQPSVVESVIAWAQTLDMRGIALVPVSAAVTVAAPPPLASAAAGGDAAAKPKEPGKTGAGGSSEAKR